MSMYDQSSLSRESKAANAVCRTAGVLGESTLPPFHFPASFFPVHRRVARMAVYCFYLFDRSGRLLCYREWCRARRTHAGEDDAKSMFGLLFALRNFCSKLSPSPLYVWDT